MRQFLHILASSGYTHATIAVRGFNACQMHRSMYPSIFNRFPVIQPVSSKVRHFSTFFAHFGLSLVRLWDNHGKCYMDGKRIQCWSNASLHIPIYLQPFLRYSKLLVENCDISYPTSVYRRRRGDPVGIS